MEEIIRVLMKEGDKVLNVRKDPGFFSFLGLLRLFKPSLYFRLGFLFISHPG